MDRPLKAAVYLRVGTAEQLQNGKESITMTETIKRQILAIRATGETNMFDINRVQHIANRKGYYELVVYLEGHRKEYANFILTGKERQICRFPHFRLAF